MDRTDTLYICQYQGIKKNIDMKKLLLEKCPSLNEFTHKCELNTEFYLKQSIINQNN